MLPNKYIDIIRKCNKCDISLYRKNVVLGYGDTNSKLIFIGEAPGAKEDKAGIPFIGNAGTLFNNTINIIGFNRNNIYVTNIIKCRPINNRNPSNVEISNCSIFLLGELEFIKPTIIVLLGNIALRSYFGNNSLKISKYRGKIINYKNTVILPIYHPSYIIRNIKNDEILSNWYNDFILLSEIYKYLINPLHITNIK